MARINFIGKQKMHNAKLIFQILRSKHKYIIHVNLWSFKIQLLYDKGDLKKIDLLVRQLGIRKALEISEQYSSFLCVNVAVVKRCVHNIYLL